MVFKFAILAACMAVAVMGYSGGAPPTVCDDMTPKHPVEPQKSQIPYKVTVDKNSVKPTESVKITIGGDKAFKGFLVEVRDGDKPVGSFKLASDNKYAKTINCGAGKSNGATHKNSADKKSITLEWRAPRTGGQKTYTVFATVAENGGVYWVRKPMATINVE